MIDEAGRVSLKLTLEASANTETDRTTLQDTLYGMYDLDGNNTLEEQKTFYHELKDIVNDQDDTNSVDSKELNCHDYEVRIRINKQNSDIAGDVHIGKGDPDDMCAMNEVQTKLLHTMQCNVTGRVPESRKHFQLETKFRDTASEHGNTHEHSMRSTRLEHQCQDNHDDDR